MPQACHNEMALAVTTDPDDDHHDHSPPTPTVVLSAALSRSAAEEAALRVLADVLERSESLATLAPRLASVEAQIQREPLPDRSEELARLAAQLATAEHYARPGLLTRSGRDDRRRLHNLSERRDALEVAQARREAWFDSHGELLGYRDDLVQQVVQRREALGARALADAPEYLVRLLGSVPDDEDRVASWARRAAGIEAYREQWGVEVNELGLGPADSIQRREWDLTVGVAERHHSVDLRMASLAIDDDGLGLGL